MCISYVSRCCEIIPHQTILSVAGKRWPRAGRTKRSAEHRTWPKKTGFCNGCNDPNLSCSLSHLIQLDEILDEIAAFSPIFHGIVHSIFQEFPLFFGILRPFPFSLRFPPARSSQLRLGIPAQEPGQLVVLGFGVPSVSPRKWNLGGSVQDGPGI